MELTEKDFNSYLYTSLKCKYYARYKPETARKKATEEYKRILKSGTFFSLLRIR